MLGKIEGKRYREWQRVRWLDSIASSMDMNLTRLWEIVEDREACELHYMGLHRVEHNLATEQQPQQNTTNGKELKQHPFDIDLPTQIR